MSRTIKAYETRDTPWCWSVFRLTNLDDSIRSSDDISKKIVAIPGSRAAAKPRSNNRQGLR